jgi:hypothetical protein
MTKGDRSENHWETPKASTSAPHLGWRSGNWRARHWGGPWAQRRGENWESHWESHWENQTVTRSVEHSDSPSGPRWVPQTDNSKGESWDHHWDGRSDCRWDGN